MTNRLIRYWFMGWFIIWQYENSEHTLRDRSQLYHSDLKPENGEKWMWQLLNQIRLANQIR